MQTSYPLRQQWLGNLRGDLLSGAVVALALIPEAIAFSLIAGVDCDRDPFLGLASAFLRRRPRKLNPVSHLKPPLS